MSLVSKELTSYLTEAYNLSSTANNEVNNQKSDFKIYGYKNILYSLIFLFLSSFLFSYKYFQKDNKSQTIEIKNIKEIVNQFKIKNDENAILELNKAIREIKSKLDILENKHKNISKKYDMINSRELKK